MERRKWTPFESITDQVIAAQQAGEPLPEETAEELWWREQCIATAVRFRAIMRLSVDRNAK